MKNHFVVCACHSSEHTLRFIHDSSDNGHYEMYTEVYLNNYRSIFKRIWVSIKYVCGYTSKYGHFDNTELSKEECVKLRDFLNNTIE
jgi:hypothetical protein